MTIRLWATTVLLLLYITSCKKAEVQHPPSIPTAISTQSAIQSNAIKIYSGTTTVHFQFGCDIGSETFDTVFNVPTDFWIKDSAGLLYFRTNLGIDSFTWRTYQHGSKVRYSFFNQLAAQANDSDIYQQGWNKIVLIGDSLVCTQNYRNGQHRNGTPTGGHVNDHYATELDFRGKYR